MKIFDKIKNATNRVKMAGAVAKIVLGGKESKTLNKVLLGTDIADKATEIAEMVNVMFPNKPKK